MRMKIKFLLPLYKLHEKPKLLIQDLLSGRSKTEGKKGENVCGYIR